jgi:hypothetical protein
VQALGLRPNQGGGLEARRNGDKKFRCLSAKREFLNFPHFEHCKAYREAGRRPGRNLRACTVPRNREVKGTTSSREQGPHCAAKPRGLGSDIFEETRTRDLPRNREVEGETSPERIRTRDVQRRREVEGNTSLRTQPSVKTLQPTS